MQKAWAATAMLALAITTGCAAKQSCGAASSRKHPSGSNSSPTFAKSGTPAL